MKTIRWSPHAEAKIVKREIDQSEAELTLKEPDSIADASANRHFYQRRYLDKMFNEPMLLRVLVEETDLGLVVVTLYKTSKFTKYERSQ